MTVKVYGSNLCPDTLHALETLSQNGISPAFINVTGSINLLADWVLTRDTNPIFEKSRGTRSVGFPTFEFEDGTMTRDIEDVLARFAAEK